MMHVKTLILSLLISSAALVVIILSPLYKSSEPESAKLNTSIPAELNVNLATASHECSHHGKE
jgi:hypothetical protein